LTEEERWWMKIIIQKPRNDDEESIIINVRKMNDNLMRIIDMLKNPDTLTVYKDKEAVFVSVSEIFYIESTAQKTLAYTEDTEYESKLKLYELERKIDAVDFLRVSRQVLVNVRKIKSILPGGDSRLIARLFNGKEIRISRQYVPALKERFGL